jgi:hypothetical protein
VFRSDEDARQLRRSALERRASDLRAEIETHRVCAERPDRTRELDAIYAASAGRSRHPLLAPLTIASGIVALVLALCMRHDARAAAARIAATSRAVGALADAVGGLRASGSNSGLGRWAIVARGEATWTDARTVVHRWDAERRERTTELSCDVELGAASGDARCRALVRCGDQLLQGGLFPAPLEERYRLAVDPDPSLPDLYREPMMCGSGVYDYLRLESTGLHPFECDHDWRRIVIESHLGTRWEIEVPR